MEDHAVVVRGSEAAPAPRRAARLLEFFGLSGRELSPDQFIEALTRGDFRGGRLRLLGASKDLERVVAWLRQRPELNDHWKAQVHSVFAYSNGSSEDWARLFGQLEDACGPAAWSQAPSTADWLISAVHPEICACLSGLRVSSDRHTPEPGFTFGQSNRRVDRLVAEGKRCALARCWHAEVPWILSSAGLLDIDQGLEQSNFDIRDHFLTAMPVVMYLRWAFPSSAWHAPESNACLIIDDPLLKPTYGYVDYDELLALMTQHDFSTNIAFIPWNWRRSHERITMMFREHAARYSISVHGCDHTSGEFGTSNTGLLAWKASLAADRMERHEGRTGVVHDRVMVFPQGVFSEASMTVLKRAGYRAAVNTEIISADPKPPRVTIADVWDVAAMTYADFPLFTRRYPAQGVVNFAFDILLGKPCLIVIHHEHCEDHCAGLLQLIDQINALAAKPAWRTLGEIVKRSYRQRELAPGIVEVEIYGTETRIVNTSGGKRLYKVRKREANRSDLRVVTVDNRDIHWDYSSGYARLEFELEPGGSANILLSFEKHAGQLLSKESIRSKMKTMLRRYLSEVRDNYVVKARRVLSSRAEKAATHGRGGVPC